MTTEANHIPKAIHVRETWGQKCSLLLFMSDADDANLKAINLQTGKGKQGTSNNVSAKEYIAVSINICP